METSRHVDLPPLSLEIYPRSVLSIVNSLSRVTFLGVNVVADLSLNTFHLPLSQVFPPLLPVPSSSLPVTESFWYRKRSCGQTTRSSGYTLEGTGSNLQGCVQMTTVQWRPRLSGRKTNIRGSWSLTCCCCFRSKMNLFGGRSLGTSFCSRK